MRNVLVSTDDFLWKLLPPAPGFSPVYVVATVATRARIARQGDDAVSGDLGDEAVYRRAFRTGHEPVLVAVPRIRLARVLAAIRVVAPAAPLVVLGEDGEEDLDLGDAVVLPRTGVLEHVVQPAVERAVTRARLQPHAPASSIPPATC